MQYQQHYEHVYTLFWCSSNPLSYWVHVPHPDDKICLAPYDKSGSQRWAVEGDKIVNRANKLRCLDIQAGNTEDGAAVIPYDFKGNANQRWEIVYV